ncbi:30S ribosomal protein S15 [Candidatus Microgenomates bacterium]|nr:30S ribosomal protein S15 [Candidatus Microgenomates bacterium]
MAKKSTPKTAARATASKKDMVDELRTHKKDTGSSEVQIGIFTRRIQALTRHLQRHKKDTHSRGGLLQMVGKRRRLLDYLKKRDFTKYKAVIKKLGLRK